MADSQDKFCMLTLRYPAFQGIAEEERKVTWPSSVFGLGFWV